MWGYLLLALTHTVGFWNTSAQTAFTKIDEFDSGLVSNA